MNRIKRPLKAVWFFFYLKSSNINNLIDYFIRIIGTNEAN
ncbi:hypothetical protein LBH_0649 [Lactobacillus helveticus H9]|nr:hypothetical protein LBH_0649 [Lactobacillus helveticus H9]